MRGKRPVPLHKQLADAANRVRLGHAIRVRRCDLGMTQEALSDALGMLPRSWAEVEQGRRWVQLHDLPTLMNLLQVEPGWFVTMMLTFGERPAVLPKVPKGTSLKVVPRG